MNETVLDLTAVEAMLKDPLMHALIVSDSPRRFMNTVERNVLPLSDWLVAAVNCVDDADILPVAMHTYLLDWRKE